jgi:hypothetical protein
MQIEKNRPLLSVLVAAVIALPFAGRESLAQTEFNHRLSNEALAKVLTLQRGTATVLRPFEDQAAGSAADDGPPSGPDYDVSPVYLVDHFASVSNYIDDDFDRFIPYSDELIRDHTSLNTYYFYPAGYLLKRNTTDGYDINFLHRTREGESSDELIILTFTLEPRHLDGAIPLLETLADYAVEPLNSKDVDLNRLAISDVNVNLGGLSTLIPEDSIRVINSPRRVGDPIRVQASMNQAQKEDIVATIRSGGLSGDIIFHTNNDAFQLIVPYYVNFTDYSGEWLTDVSELSTADSVRNVSPFPLLVQGVAAYVKPRSGRQIKRYFAPLAEPVVMPPGAVASSDKAYGELFSSYGDSIATWVVWERVTCEDCLNAIERDILVSPAMASRAELSIEAIPNVFDQYSLFKILLEVRSNYFSASGDLSETKSFTLRPDATHITVPLFVDRDAAGSIFEYRIKPFHSSGSETAISEWQPDGSLMDITVHSGMIAPLFPGTE